nr:plasmid segregation protein ParM domain-containing protein [Klebsiella variicola]
MWASTKITGYRSRWYDPDVGVIVGQFEDVSAVHGNPDIGVSMVTKATLTALKMASSDTSPMIADELIKNRENPDFVGQVVNEAAKQNLVLDTIDTAIHKLGELVVDDLLQYRNVNRVYIVGGGAALIADAVRKAWNHLGEKVVLMDEPQTALVQRLHASKRRSNRCTTAKKGKLSLYLHPEDSADRLALAEIETVPGKPGVISAGFDNRPDNASA